MLPTLTVLCKILEIPKAVDLLCQLQKQIFMDIFCSSLPSLLQVLMNRETSSSVQTIPDDLFDKVLTIVDQVTETSLIASSLLHRRPVSLEVECCLFIADCTPCLSSMWSSGTIVSIFIVQNVYVVSSDSWSIVG